MILPIAGFGTGLILGALMARARGGKLADLAQWGAVLGIVGALIGLFVLIFWTRAAMA